VIFTLLHGEYYEVAEPPNPLKYEIKPWFTGRSDFGEQLIHCIFIAFYFSLKVVIEPVGLVGKVLAICFCC
jgi:hypothetical protein